MSENDELNETKGSESVANAHATVAGIKRMLGKWARRALALEILLAFLGVVSIASTLLISSFANSEFMHRCDFLMIKLLGFASTLSLTTMGSFNIPSKANGVRKGWRHLNKAYFRYNSGVVDIKELVVAYDEASNMIGSNVDFNYASKPGQSVVSRNITGQ